MTKSSPDESQGNKKTTNQNKAQKSAAPTSSEKKGHKEKPTQSTHVKQPQAPVAKSNSACCILSILLIVLIICAIAVISYFLFQTQQKVEQSKTNIQQTQTSVANYKDNLSLQKQLLDKQQTEITQLLKNSSHKKRDWVLAEVEYLTRIANFLLQFENNVPAAIQLLETADQRLVALSDPELMSVRDRLSKDISQLEEMPKIDTEGILLKLNILSQKINALPSILMPVEKNKNKDSSQQTSQDSTKETTSWQQGLKQSWEKLKEIIVIEHHEQPRTASAAKYDRIYIDQHLQFLLQQAQWATIHQKEALYAMSLHQAQTWVKQNYANNSNKTQAMIKTLDSLAQIDIKPEYPTLTETIKTIQTMIINDNKYGTNVTELDTTPTDESVVTPATIGADQAPDKSDSTVSSQDDGEAADESDTAVSSKDASKSTDKTASSKDDSKSTDKPDTTASPKDDSKSTDKPDTTTSSKDDSQPTDKPDTTAKTKENIKPEDKTQQSIQESKDGAQ